MTINSVVVFLLFFEVRCWLFVVACLGSICMVRCCLVGFDCAFVFGVRIYWLD